MSLSNHHMGPNAGNECTMGPRGGYLGNYPMNSNANNECTMRF